jgi:hypothetical protein
MSNALMSIKHLIKKYSVEVMKYITNTDNGYYDEFLNRNGMKEIFFNLFSKILYCDGLIEEERTIITDFKGKFLFKVFVSNLNHEGQPCDIEHLAVPIHERKEITMFVLFLPDIPAEIEIIQKRKTNKDNEITKINTRLVWDGKNLNLLNKETQKP